MEPTKRLKTDADDHDPDDPTDDRDDEFVYRPLTAADRGAYGILVHGSFNAWYWRHGWNGDFITCTPDEAAVFLDVYLELDGAGHSVAAFHAASGQLAGACFYHVRPPSHVSLGVMCVHASFEKRGVGRNLVRRIVREQEERGLPSLRLMSSALSMDSFSLYNRAGFTPRVLHQDMVVTLPAPAVRREEGVPLPPGGGVEDRDAVTTTTTDPDTITIRHATPDDVPAMVQLEELISGITRPQDFEYCIRDERRMFDVYVATERDPASTPMVGFCIALRCPLSHQLGPGVARDDVVMTRLFHHALTHTYEDQTKDDDDGGGSTSVLAVVPVRATRVVRYLYGRGAKNVETHFLQVKGAYQEMNGVSIPSFLPETG